MIESLFLAALLGTMPVAEFRNSDVETKIEILAEKYDQDPLVARAIICAESKNDSDAVNKNLNKHGEVWSRDYGFFQINDYFHRKDAAKLGLDIKEPDDNLVYGFYILSKQGTKPWNASKFRWQKMLKEGKTSCGKIRSSQEVTVAQL